MTLKYLLFLPLTALLTLTTSCSSGPTGPEIESNHYVMDGETNSYFQGKPTRVETLGNLEIEILYEKFDPNENIFVFYAQVANTQDSSQLFSLKNVSLEVYQGDPTSAPLTTLAAKDPMVKDAEFANKINQLEDERLSLTDVLSDTVDIFTKETEAKKKREERRKAEQKSYEDQIADVTKRRETFLKKSLLSSRLKDKEKISGLLYFPLPAEQSKIDPDHLHLIVTSNQGKQKKVVFRFKKVLGQ